MNVNFFIIKMMELVEMIKIIALQNVMMEIHLTILISLMEIKNA